MAPNRILFYENGGPVMDPSLLEQEALAAAAGQPDAMSEIDAILAELDRAGQLGAIAGGLSGLPLGSRLGRRLAEQIAMAQQQAAEGYAEGGPVGGAPNRMTAYQQARASEAGLPSVLGPSRITAYQPARYQPAREAGTDLPSVLVPNRMTAYQQARAAEGPQRGLTYSELLLDNILGLDNEYQSYGETLGQQFNADEIGFLRDAGVAAYQGAKEAVLHPLDTSKEALLGLYNAGAGLATEDLNDRLLEMYGVTYDQATDEQINRARESFIGDAMTVASVLPVAKPLEGAASAGLRPRAPGRGPSPETNPFSDLLEDPDIEDLIQREHMRQAAASTPVRELMLREQEGIELNAFERERVNDYLARNNIGDAAAAAATPNALDRLPTLLDRMRRGEPLTEEEAFDVMTYERYGTDGVYDPTNTFENWSTQGGDEAGAARIAYLTGARQDIGGFALPREPGPYFTAGADPYDMLGIPQNPPVPQAPQAPQALPRFPDWNDLEYSNLELGYNADDIQLTDDQIARLQQYDNVRLSEIQDGDVQLYPGELQEVAGRLGVTIDQPTLPPPPPVIDPWGFDEPDPFSRPPLPASPPRPAIGGGRDAGIASLYSPTRRAVDRLDRPVYEDLESLQSQLLARGAKPDELARVVSRLRTEGGPVTKERIAEITDQQSGDLILTYPLKTYSDNFLKGAEDVQATVFEFPVDRAPAVASEHFTASEPGRAPLMHIRTGKLYSSRENIGGEPDVYFLGEVQSDWAQRRAKLYPTEAELNAAAARKQELEARKTQLEDERAILMANINRTRNEDPTLPRDPQDLAKLKALTEEGSDIRDEIKSINTRTELTNAYGFRGDYDQDYSPAPYIGTTSKWVQLGLRQALLDAVNSGSRRMALPVGDEVKEYTYGTLKGQRSFYGSPGSVSGSTVQKELNDVLRRFSKEHGVKQPELKLEKVYGSNGVEYEFPVLDFSDEFIEAVKRHGMPAYARGGVVKGSYLDVDVFEPTLR